MGKKTLIAGVVQQSRLDKSWEKIRPQLVAGLVPTLSTQTDLIVAREKLRNGRLTRVYRALIMAALDFHGTPRRR